MDSYSISWCSLSFLSSTNCHWCTRIIRIEYKSPAPPATMPMSQRSLAHGCERSFVPMYTFNEKKKMANVTRRAENDHGIFV